MKRLLCYRVDIRSLTFNPVTFEPNKRSLMKAQLVISAYLLCDGSLYHPKQLHIYCVYMHSWHKVTHEDD